MLVCKLALQCSQADICFLAIPAERPPREIMSYEQYIHLVHTLFSKYHCCIKKKKKKPAPWRKSFYC